MKLIVGIDLGTTHSLIGQRIDGQVVFAEEAGSSLIPSYLYFPGDEPIVGAQAKEARKTEPEKVVFSVKRFLGVGKKDLSTLDHQLPLDFSPSTDSIIKFKAGDVVVNPIECSQWILKKLKDLALAQWGNHPVAAVITVPAYFNDAQRSATHLAAQAAGIEVLRILNEPTAAALAYGLNQKTRGTIAVFDLGGGTFDLSILRLQDGVFEVVSTHGDTRLGGDDLDQAILEGILPQLIAQGFSKESLSSNSVRSELLLFAEKLKRKMTESNEVSDSFQSLTVHITREEAYQWVLPLLKKCGLYCELGLKDACLSKQDLSDVVLVGGSTKSPLVQRYVKDFFGRELLCSLNPEEVVALGATLQAHQLSGQSSQALLLDILPLSLGIETMGGVVSKILHRNSPIPSSATENFSTYVDGQVNIDLHVLQGEREVASDCRSLARFQLKGIPPMPAGIPKIEVEFIVDANGMLSVRAIEKRSATAASIVVNPSYGLSTDEIENMLQASFDHAESDIEKRMWIESKNEAEILMKSTEKSLERGHHLLNADEKAKIDDAIHQVRSLLPSNHRKALREACENLKKSTENFGQSLLNETVSHILKGASHEMDRHS